MRPSTLPPVKRLLVAAAALAFAAPVLAAPPQVTGRAYMVENGTTGEVLARRNARERVPIASITKLMTVLLTVERHGPPTSSPSAPAAADVGESSAEPAGRRAADRPRAARGGADPERERRRGRARRLRGQGQRGALRRADEPACTAARAARHALRPARRARRHRARLQRPRRDAAGADPDAPAARAADRPPAGARRSRAGARCTPGTTCSRATRASSASRPATPRRPAGTRSRRRAGAAR